jgi:hypothetical protein
MFTDNPFAALSATVPPLVMQIFVAAMIVLVGAGTLFDVLHKRSGRYFFDTWRSAKSRGRPIAGGKMAALAVQAVVVDGLASGEFCNVRRRIAHLLTMYGFLAYALSTVILVFWYPTPVTPAPAILAQLWHVGALLICLGGYWFWFFIRVDVAAEGKSPFRVVRADLFIVALLKSATLALIWSWLQTAGSPWANLVLGLYIVATIVLFASVPWSKFSHMFYKPAAAFQKRVEEASGSRSNLPEPAATPETFGSARTQPRHY